VNQKVIAMFLTKRKVPFSLANNGLEACQMVKEKPFGYYALILMDLAMPVWDGYRV
jgi:CheY-like chemotaxis protein